MRVMVVFDYLRWSEQDAALVEIQSAFQRSFPGFSVAMRGCWGSSTCLIEVRTELDETTDAGLASLGRLANCNRVLRECLFDRIVASEGPVRQMTYMAGPEEPRPSASPGAPVSHRHRILVAASSSRVSFPSLPGGPRLAASSLRHVVFVAPPHRRRRRPSCAPVTAVSRRAARPSPPAVVAAAHHVGSHECSLKSRSCLTASGRAGESGFRLSVWRFRTLESKLRRASLLPAPDELLVVLELRGAVLQQSKHGGRVWMVLSTTARAFRSDSVALNPISDPWTQRLLHQLRNDLTGCC